MVSFLSTSTEKRTWLAAVVASLTMILLCGAVAAPVYETFLAVDFGTAGLEIGFQPQAAVSQVHSTPKGDVSISFSGQQGFFVFASSGANTNLYSDFMFDNSGPMTMTLTGLGIASNTEYQVSFWSYYGAEARNTTITPTSGTTGPTVGPISTDNAAPTELYDVRYWTNGLFVSDATGTLTFSLGAGRPAINALAIAAKAPPAGTIIIIR